VLAALAGVALTGVAALGVAPRWDAASQQAELDALGESRRLVVQRALADLASLLQAMAAQLSQASRAVEPRDLEPFAAAAAQASGGVVELAWMAPIAAPVALARGDDAGEPRFTVAFVVAPLAPSAADGAPEPLRAAAERSALELALERGGVAATSVPGAGRATAVAFVPVGAPGGRGARPAGGPRVVGGLVRCRFDPGALVERVLGGVQVPRGLDLHLFGDGAGAAELPLAVRGSVLRRGPAPPRRLAELLAGPHWRAPVQLAEARWTLVATPMPGGPIATEHGRSVSVALAGLLLTALLVAYVAAVGGQERRLAGAADASRADAAAARYRGELLHAIAAAAKELAGTERIEEALARALRAVGEAALVDRVVVLERVEGRDGRPATLVTRNAWRSALAPAVLPGEPVGAEEEDDPERHLLAFAEGRPYAAVVSALPPPLRDHLEALGVRSTLLVPMEVDGRPFGALTLDDCTADREWSAAEIDILKTLSDLVAASIARARHVKELADANTIVENSTTVLFRLRGEPGLPMSFISRNVAALGHDPEALLRDPRSYLSLVHPDDVERVRAGLDRVLAGEAGAEVRELRLRVWGGSWRWFESRHAPVRDAAGRIVELEGVLVDVTERKKAEERIAAMARTDALTGVANRATFVERLELAFSSAARNRRPFAVLYLDLDRFKEVNDTHGHAAGDELISTVARRLVESTRRTDLVARLGGDEFAVLGADLADASGAGALARKICAAVSAPCEVAGRALQVTASVGIAQWTPQVASPEELLAQADRALYLAKDEGRDRFRFHSEALDADVRLHAALGDELPGALARDELELHYQPQVELATGRIAGMEALVRWRHPARGLLGPADFLPVAERTGAILPLGRWVLDRACGQMSAWRRGGIAPAVLVVNLSLAQLRTGLELVDAVSRTLSRWDLPADALELDVTEAMLAHAASAPPDVLEGLRALGVRIAVDDFGTQSSCLEYLRGSRVSRLTVPRSILDGAGRDGRDGREAATVRAIAAVARELGLELVAQGIETEAQRELLVSVAASAVGQGYLFSRPVPADRATELLRAPGLAPAARGAGAPRSAAAGRQ
jgi:diguanylate cyclase (GGDEF)-like protein/PAS domain S-box-containing protein